MKGEAAVRHASTTPFQCGLCGLEFAQGEGACGSCAICPGCDLVKCPRCGYQFPSGSSIVRLFQRLARASRCWR